MKKSILYLILLILIVGGISAYHMKKLSPGTKSTVKSEYTDYFPVPELGDLYILKTPDSLHQYFKITRIFSADSFALAYGTEKVTPEETTRYFWGKSTIESDLLFEENKREYINFQDLKAIFESENFAVIYRYRNQKMDLPWYAWLFNSSFGFPIISFLIFIIMWIFSGVGQVLHHFIPKIPAQIGYYSLTMFLMFLYFISAHHEFFFPDTWIAILYTILAIPSFLLVYRYISVRYFSKMEFANREALRFVTMSVGGITFEILGFSVGFLIYFIFPEWKTHHVDYLTGIKMVLYPTVLIWTAIATSNSLNNIRQKFNQLKAKEKNLVKAQKSELSSKAELDALQARINPHFLYNSLNSIASLAQIDPKKTEEMAIALSQFYKYSTNRADEYMTSVADEVEILKTYLEIEKIRFGERLQFGIDTHNLKNEWQIPRFLLQPLAENAVKYGYNKTTNQILIEVKISDSAQQLTIEILDSGTPFLEDMKIGYGLSSIQKKLQLLFPERHSLEFINQPKKSVIIKINFVIPTVVEESDV